jgi:RNA polymerase sigma-70 factor (ECF subfamily)
VSDLVATRFPVLPISDEAPGSNSVSDKQPPRQVDITDEILLSRITGGDQQALGCLYRRYGRLLHSIAARILRDRSEAEDLVQDLLFFIHRRAVIFDSSKSSARSWIVQMTYHRAISRRRYLVTRGFYTHEKVEGIAERVVGVATTENDYSVERVFGRNGLEKVMQALSEDQRETLRLHFFEGYTLSEVSEKLGQPRGSVRHHYYRGLAHLRKQMSASKVRVVEPHGK